MILSLINSIHGNRLWGIEQNDFDDAEAIAGAVDKIATCTSSFRSKTTSWICRYTRARPLITRRRTSCDQPATSLLSGRGPIFPKFGQLHLARPWVPGEFSERSHSANAEHLLALLWAKWMELWDEQREWENGSLGVRPLRDSDGSDIKTLVATTIVPRSATGQRKSRVRSLTQNIPTGSRLALRDQQARGNNTCARSDSRARAVCAVKRKRRCDRCMDDLA